MKVLLTGASGFVGSHILDRLRARNIPTAVLLRPSSDRRHIARHFPDVELRPGSITDPQSLHHALEGITEVIHCAGCTKARKHSEFYVINQVGTRQVVEAVNARKHEVRRLLHISSLAVSGPATPAQPARESDPARPVSEYGKSKLAGELEVREHCQVEFVVLRPPAVYGPRDTGFLPMFQAVNWHILPQPSRHQALSLVYVEDLAEAAVTCLLHPATAGKTYFAASTEVVTGGQMAEEIAAQMNRWTIPFPLPAAVLWPVCLLQEALSHLTRRAALLNLQKFAELRAPGWVCAPDLLRQDTGFACATGLREGVRKTLTWYQENRWL